MKVFGRAAAAAGARQGSVAAGCRNIGSSLAHFPSFLCAFPLGCCCPQPLVILALQPYISLSKPVHAFFTPQYPPLRSPTRPSPEQVHNLYQLPDGSAWVEHSRLVDADALVSPGAARPCMGYSSQHGIFQFGPGWSAHSWWMQRPWLAVLMWLSAWQTWWMQESMRLVGVGSCSLHGCERVGHTHCILAVITPLQLPAASAARAPSLLTVPSLHSCPAGPAGAARGGGSRPGVASRPQPQGALPAHPPLPQPAAECGGRVLGLPRCPAGHAAPGGLSRRSVFLAPRAGPTQPLCFSHRQLRRAGSRPLCCPQGRRVGS